MIVSPDGFDWLQEEPVVQEQLATTVYINDHGELVIRQKADAYDDGDTIVLLALDNAAALAHRILETVASRRGRQYAESIYEEDGAAPAPNTNAERQRRHRERKRNGVTPAVTDPVTGNADHVTQEVPQLLLAAE
jgi:hypothetical protein